MSSSTIFCPRFCWCFGLTLSVPSFCGVHYCPFHMFMFSIVFCLMFRLSLGLSSLCLLSAVDVVVYLFIFVITFGFIVIDGRYYLFWHCFFMLSHVVFIQVTVWRNFKNSKFMSVNVVVIDTISSYIYVMLNSFYSIWTLLCLKFKIVCYFYNSFLLYERYVLLWNSKLFMWLFRC